MTKRVRSKVLEERGWTTELWRFYLTSTPGGFALDEVEAAEKTAQWRQDRTRAHAGMRVAYSTSELTERGWTRTMIKKLLGEPDRVITITASRKAHRYRAERVEEIEATADFAERRAAAARRSATGKAVAQHRADEVLQAVEQIASRLRVQAPESRKALRRLALDHQQDLYQMRGDLYSDTEGADGATIDRWCRNYLRHQCSNYDELLDELQYRFRGTPGVGDIYDKIIRPRINTLIDDELRALREKNRQFRSHG